MEINNDLIIKGTNKSLNDLIEENRILKERLDSKILGRANPDNVTSINCFSGKKLEEGYYRLRGLIWTNNEGTGVCPYINNTIKNGTYMEINSLIATATSTTSASLWTGTRVDSTVPRIGAFFPEEKGMLDCSFYYDGVNNLYYRSIIRTVKSGRQRIAEFAGTLLSIGEITSFGISTENSYTFKKGTFVDLIKEDL